MNVVPVPSPRLSAYERERSLDVATDLIRAEVVRLTPPGVNGAPLLEVIASSRRLLGWPTAHVRATMTEGPRREKFDVDYLTMTAAVRG